MTEDDILLIIGICVGLAILAYAVSVVYGSVSGAVNNISIKFAKREATKKYNEAKILWKKEENLHQERETAASVQQKHNSLPAL